MKIAFASVILATLFAANPALAKDQLITQKNKQFSVEEVTVSVGDKVTFKNEDETSHNVFSSTEGQKFNLGIQKQGSESVQTFTAPGTVEVRCAIHPKMKLKVTIKP